MSRGTPIPIRDFHGGVNTKVADSLVGLDECRNCSNVVSTNRGSIKKRNGCPTFAGTFTGAPAQIMSLVGVEVTGPVMVATASTKFYSIGTTGVTADITGGATVTNNARWEMIEAPASGGQGPVWGMNGIDTPKYWTGAGNIADWTAASGSLPNGKYVIYFKNKVWVAGTSANPSRLFWSDVGDPRAWPAANVADFDPNDGDIITGLGTFGPYLLVFKRNKVFRVHDLNTGANTTLSISIGASSQRSIVESPLGTFFLTNDKGVFIYNGTTLRQLSEKITPTLEGVVAANREFAAGAFYQNHYYLSVCPSGGANNTLTLDYDTQLDSWWFHTNTSNEYALWRRTNIYELFQASTIGTVDSCFVSGVLQDNSVNFTCLWLGAWLTYGGLYRRRPWEQPYENKRWRQIQIDGSGIVDIYLGKDYFGQSLLKADVFNVTGTSPSLFGGSDTFGGGGVFGDTGAQTRARLYSLGVARAFSIQFLATTNTTFEVDAYTPFITARTN